LESVRHCQLTVEQPADRLRNHGLAVAGRSVHEHRMGRADGGANLIEDALAQHQMRERLSHACASDRSRHGISIGLEIRHVLREWHRSDTDILIALEEQHGALASAVRDPIAKRGSADAGSADDFALMQTLDEFERRLDDGEFDAEAARHLDAGQLAGKMQLFEYELDE